MDYLSVKSTEKKKSKAEKVDCGKSGGREESSFLFHMRLPACLQERAILKGGKTGRTNKSNVGGEGEEVTGESTEIKTSIVQSFQTSQLHSLSMLHIQQIYFEIFPNVSSCKQACCTSYVSPTKFTSSATPRKLLIRSGFCIFS